MRLPTLEFHCLLWLRDRLHALFLVLLLESRLHGHQQVAQDSSLRPRFHHHHFLALAGYISRPLGPLEARRAGLLGGCVGCVFMYVSMRRSGGGHSGHCTNRRFLGRRRGLSVDRRALEDVGRRLIILTKSSKDDKIWWQHG